MKHTLTTFLIFLFLAGQVQAQWTQKQNFPGKGNQTTAFSIDNSGYFVTGDSIDNFWRYDPASNVWTKLPDFPGAKRINAVGFSIGSKGYVGTGHDPIHAGIRYTDLWAYDVNTNSWQQKAGFPSTARGEASGFSIGNKGYLGGGGLRDFWEYDPAMDSWSRKSDMGIGNVRFAVSFAINNKGYMGTGDTGGVSGPLKDFWEYDPANDRWTRKADFGGGPRAYATGFAVNGKGYIGTGYEMYALEKDDLWEYNPSTDQWLPKENIGSGGRYQSQGLSIGNKGYIGMGHNSGTGHGESVPLKDFWEYTPTTPTAMGENNRSADFNIFPNPAKGNIYLRALNPGSTILVSDMLGNRIYATQAELPVQTIALPPMQSGIYILSIVDKKETMVRKLVIEN